MSPCPSRRRTCCWRPCLDFNWRRRKPCTSATWWWTLKPRALGVWRSGSCRPGRMTWTLCWRHGPIAWFRTSLSCRLWLPQMNEVTRILSAIDQGDPHAAEALLPLVYEELRKLAAQRLGHEAPGQTLQATALVHEAYLRLVDTEKVQHWNSRGHFFAAAAEAMRRILIEQARRKRRTKHGGDRKRAAFDEALSIADGPSQDMLALDEVLNRLEATDPLAAKG